MSLVPVDTYLITHSSKKKNKWMGCLLCIERVFCVMEPVLMIPNYAHPCYLRWNSKLELDLGKDLLVVTRQCLCFRPSASLVDCLSKFINESSLHSFPFAHDFNKSYTLTACYVHPDFIGSCHCPTCTQPSWHLLYPLWYKCMEQKKKKERLCQFWSSLSRKWVWSTHI